jgi:acetyl-CoA carboxylase carboxyl transferase beta subunit
VKLHNMFKKTVGKEHGTSKNTKVRNVPEGLLKKCNKCGAAILAEDAVNNNYICPKCHGYFRMHAGRRIEMIADPGTFEEWDAKMDTSDPLNFPGYKNKLERQRSVTNLDEAVITGKGKILGKDVVIAVMGADFMMGSMGEVVGEKITRAVERATQMRLPIIIFTCSGGARMQEGIVSLMQMAKTSAALKRHDEAGLLYITVLTDPTTGGVTASFAMLGDVILAEPGALIGFAGPRVIEQTIGQKLPEGFQRAEFLLEHGFVDKIVERKKLRKVLVTIIRSCEYEQ